jgi:isoaspartyl peptidase/L-asparaginase-like protein (Ntn-hydrolase superfamily)
MLRNLLTVSVTYVLFYVSQISSEEAVQRMEKRINGYGGVIVIDEDGNFGKAFNTKRMAWATVKDDVLQYGLKPNECIKVDLK